MRRASFLLPAIAVVVAAACFLAVEVRGQPARDTDGDGTPPVSYRETNMHLCREGKWGLGEDKWGKIVRVNVLKIAAADWAKVPGVKKAWPMKGYEGVAGMAFHPVISEVKDVDADGKAEIFRCRSEHPGARIERLSCDDGSAVWQSEPLGALHGDESRLPVFARQSPCLRRDRRAAPLPGPARLARVVRGLQPHHRPVARQPRGSARRLRSPHRDGTAPPVLQAREGLLPQPRRPA